MYVGKLNSCSFCNLARHDFFISNIQDVIVTNNVIYLNEYQGYHL
jgi:hypothetical protein